MWSHCENKGPDKIASVKEKVMDVTTEMGWQKRVLLTDPLA